MELADTLGLGSEESHSTVMMYGSSIFLNVEDIHCKKKKSRNTLKTHQISTGKEIMLDIYTDTHMELKMINLQRVEFKDTLTIKGGKKMQHASLF